MSFHRNIAAFLLGVAIAVPGCAKNSPAPVSKVAGGRPILISAAASTTDAMEALAEGFRKETGLEVKVNPGPSSGLAQQIIAGAPADLFLSANVQWADELDKKDKAAEKARLLTNKLVLIAPESNPAGVKAPEDLLSEQVKKVALAGEAVPAGIYAQQALTKLGLYAKLEEAGKIVRGQDVRSALGYVAQGEAEAGVAYSTDVGVAPQVKTVYEFDPKLHDEIVYVLVLVKNENSNPDARRFYEFLQSDAAGKKFAEFGFERL